ncbi:MAG: PQQ-like beta-propeller repeat protein [Phycisphaerales bacterium]|nr:MAG: PQQ-like beta-propeller repeat protein [Phycisphaerales bacterium]
MKYRLPLRPLFDARCLLSFAGIAALLGPVASSSAQWPQWGGPNRDFASKTRGLAEVWPEEGPPKLWHRELGEGYSSIVVDDGRLYTMYRVEEDEFSIALDAKTGRTVWEYKNASPFTEHMTLNGPGPHATPLVAGDRLYTIGTNAVLHCFDKKSGAVLWKHDLINEFGAPAHEYGYPCSPIAYKNTVIVLAGGPQPADGGAAPNAGLQALIAFDQASGNVIWKGQDLPVEYSSPILIHFGGKDQLILATSQGLTGVDPNDGARLWHHAWFTGMPQITTPVWNGGDLIFASAAHDSGSRAIRLNDKEGTTVPEELWYSRKLRILHGNAVLINDHVYGTTGDVGTVALVVCMNLRTGQRAWFSRGFDRATCVYGDGKLILLDGKGQLALATVTPEGLTVHSKCQMTAEAYSWTPPTLAGTTLYLRDRHHIMALDVGAKDAVKES